MSSSNGQVYYRIADVDIGGLGVLHQALGRPNGTRFKDALYINREGQVWRYVIIDEEGGVIGNKVGAISTNGNGSLDAEIRDAITNSGLLLICNKSMLARVKKSEGFNGEYEFVKI